MDAISRRLLFWIGSVGFCLNLSELVEIREQAADQVDCRQNDPQLSVIGSLSFRRTKIPVIDLAQRLGVHAEPPNNVLVLNSPEGNWGLLVGSVEGFCPAAKMIDRPVPRLLQAKGWRCFEQIALYEGRPFLRLDIAACYAGSKA